MKILIVHSGNAVDNSEQYTFIKDQANALTTQGHEIDYFAIRGKGVKGYLKNYIPLKNKIKLCSPDVIHAHFGFSGALAVMQRKIPVVITFHNGETLSKISNIISSVASVFSAYNIFVANHIYNSFYIKKEKKKTILPCGINLDKLQIISQEEAKRALGLPSDKINILFGGAFSNLRKNVTLANQAISLLKDKENINLIEMRGWSHEQVGILFCAVDMMLLTTKSEGSPQVIKEAMACNCPIVATDVADIRYLFGNTANCFLTAFEPKDVAEKIACVIANPQRTNGRERIMELQLDNKNIAIELINIYDKVLKDR